MSKLPPLGPLIAFRAAATHESLTKAAHELHLTHGAISRAVKQLEEHFGFPLFHRRGRGIFLTEKGSTFAGEVESTFKKLEAACEQLRMSETKRRLSLSCEPSLAMRWLMPRLESFYTAHPDIDVHLSTAGGPIDLSAEGVHIAIRRSDFAWPKSYWVTKLGKERIGPVCSPKYWQAQANLSCTLLHTRTRPEAWADWNSHTTTPLAASGQQFFDHFYFSLQAAMAGLGFAIGPESLVADDMQQGLLVAPFGFVTTPVEYVVLSLEDPKADMHTNTFVTWLKDELNLEE